MNTTSRGSGIEAEAKGGDPAVEEQAAGLMKGGRRGGNTVDMLMGLDGGK